MSTSNRDVEELVQIVEHESKGKILVATQQLKPSQTILHEKPVIIIPESAESVM
jgi:hypothetical protein